MSDRAHQGFSTRAIRAASKTPAVNQRPTTVPIYQTATFTSSDAEELADVVSDGRAGYSYSRLSNPTSRALGDAFAEISGAEAGTTLASGMGAVHAALGANLSAGDRVVGPLAAYGSSRKLLSEIFRRYGVRVDLVDMHTHQSLWKDGTNLFYDEKGYALLSDTARWYIGGLLKHAKAVLAFAAPTTNSYRRLVPGYEAPINLVYSQRNRSAWRAS